ncbi:MAG: non-ribosomal peptide synthetase, partial [Verrucomicrobiaceae bacterium]
ARVVAQTRQMITPHPVFTHRTAAAISSENRKWYPSTSLQQGMVFHWLSAPNTGIDIEQLVCVLPESIDATHLRRAWEQACIRHPALRTRFCLKETPEQEILPECALDWNEEDLSTQPPTQQQAWFARFLAEDRHQGFNLTAGPLWRLMLLKLGEKDYRLIWTFHHAILDGRSFTIVLSEVLKTLEAFSEGQTTEFQSLPEFGEFALWRNQLDPTASEEFWRRTFTDFAAPTPLPLKGLPDCALHSAQGDVDLRLSKEVTQHLVTFAEANDLTINTLLQGAWAILLSRYSGEKEVVFGATRACRHASVPGAEQMVGLLINTLPVRVCTRPDFPLLPWLKEIRAHWIAMRDHEHTPLPQIQSWSGLTGNLRLFDTLVVYENRELNHAIGSRSSSGACRDFRLHEQTGFGLTLTAFGGEELLLRLEFNEAEFSRTTAARIIRHVATLLEAFLKYRDRSLKDLEFLADEERNELLGTSNCPPRTTSSELPLHELFKTQALRNPQAIALSYKDEVLTYAELDQRSDTLAAYLQSLGVKPEMIVGLRMERTNALIVALLAILKAGGAYLPVDLSYPPDRVAFMLSDAKVSVLLTESHLVASLTTIPPHVVCLDRWELLEHYQHAPSGCLPDNLAYIIYTSGSTGQPKGCMVTHRNVTRLFTETEEWFKFNATDVWTMFHSIAFDFSVWEIWGALLYGGRLVIVPHATSRSPVDFRKLLAQQRVTILNQTPSAFRQLIEADRA